PLVEPDVGGEQQVLVAGGGEAAVGAVAHRLAGAAGHHGRPVHGPAYQDAVLIGGVAELVRRGHLGGDGLERGRGLGGGPPLVPARVGGAGHAHLAVAPRLLGQPLDQVGAVGLVAAVERVPVALGVVAAAGVGEGDGVAAAGEPLRPLDQAGRVV